MKKSIVYIITFSLLLLLTGRMEVVAESNYNSYTIGNWNESLESPDTYSAILSKIGTDLGIGALKEPQDIFIDKKGYIYIADTGNSRIVVLDDKLNLIEVIDHVIEDVEEVPVTDPGGIHVTENGLLYISQTSLARVIVVEDGKIVKKFKKPVHNLISGSFSFQPTKITIDIYNRLYVLSKGCYTGLLQFDSFGKFLGFYGANKVEVTADVVFQYMWKNLLSDAQREAMTSILPIEYSSVTAHSDGFVYTTTVGTETLYNQIKRLNPLGLNTYFARGNREINFGDYELANVKGVPTKPLFIDLCVDEDGFVFGLELTTGRVFERDQEGNLIAVFGGLGKQLGTFSNAVAIDQYRENVYVLDAIKGSITMFEPTEYGSLVREATKYYNEGDYASSAMLWEEVSKRNGNNRAAYIGQGKAMMQDYHYKEAMDFLKAGGERYTYQRAFAKYRLEVIREYAPYVAVVFGVAVILIGIYKTLGKKKKRRGGNLNEA